MFYLLSLKSLKLSVSFSASFTDRWLTADSWCRHFHIKTFPTGQHHVCITKQKRRSIKRPKATGSAVRARKFLINNALKSNARVINYWTFTTATLFSAFFSTSDFASHFLSKLLNGATLKASTHTLTHPPTHTHTLRGGKKNTAECSVANRPQAQANQNAATQQL